MTIIAMSIPLVNSFLNFVDYQLAFLAAGVLSIIALHCWLHKVIIIMQPHEILIKRSPIPIPFGVRKPLAIN